MELNSMSKHSGLEYHFLLFLYFLFVCSYHRMHEEFRGQLGGVLFYPVGTRGSKSDLVACAFTC